MADVSIRLLADTAKATSEIAKFASGAKLLLGAFAGFTVIKSVAESIEHFAEKAVESEQAVNRLEVALKLAGDFSKEASAGFQQLASKIEAQTGISDELVLNQIALAKSFNLTNKEAQALVIAAVDLSAATGKDLNESVRALGQTFDGTAGKIAEQIPQLKDLSASQLRAGEAVRVVGERFKGAGEAIGNSFGGRVLVLKESFGNLIETLGSFITRNSFILAAIKLAIKAFEDLNKLIIQNREQILAFTKSAVLGLIDGFTILVEVIKDIHLGLSGIIGLVKLAAGFTQKLFGADVSKANTFDEILNGLDSTKSAYEKVAQAAQDYRVELEKVAPKQLEVTKSGSDFLKNADKSSSASRGTSVKDFLGSDTGKIVQASLSAGGQAGVIAGIKAGIDVAVPGLGQALGPLIEVFAQGPEKVREFFTSFIQALPTVITNIIEGAFELVIVLIEQIPELILEKLPAAIERIIDRAPEFIQRLVEHLPDLIQKFAEQFPFLIAKLSVELNAAMPKIAITFVTALVKEAPRFVQAMISELTGGIVGGGSDKKGVEKVPVIGGLLAGLGHVFGFAEGGLVPSGFPGDSFPARLTSGELIIERSDTQKLREFLDNQAGSQNLAVNLQIGEKQLADVLLNINRQGFRTA